MKDNNDEAPKACEGEPTRPEATGMGDFEACLVCGRSIRWDLVDHPFFGWQTCPRKAQESLPHE